MFFKASLDKMAKALTIAITIVFVIVIGGNVVLFNAGERLVSVLTILLIAGIYISIYLFHITGYEVVKDALIIHRPIKNKSIPLNDIARGRKIEKGELRWTLRTFGNGGLFGYTGHFFNKKIGSMRWFATRLDQGVLLQTRDEFNILLTPDEPEAFLQALRQ